MEEKEESITVETKKKKKGWLKFLITILVLGLVVVALGFIFPGLIWTKSLGVSYTKADYDSIMAKLEYIKDSAPTTGTAEDYKYVYGELVNVNVSFTSEELTAFLNYNRPDYFAVKNVQIKLNNDGSMEASGNLNVDYVLNEFLSGEYSRANIQEEIPALGLLPKTVNVYIKASGSVYNNSAISPSVQSLSVQGISIPSKYYASSEAVSEITSGVNNLINSYNKKSTAVFENISVENSKLNFKGQVPSSLERTPLQ